MKAYLKRIGARRIIGMVLGIILLGLGVSLFKFSMLGNDPSSAMVMAIADKVNIGFAPMLLAANCIWFIGEIIWGRKYIGLGTFVNWFGVGYASTFFTMLINRSLTAPADFGQKLMVMVIGVVVLCLACSLYQTADLGIAPYDSLSLIMAERLPLKYFWCRIITDSAGFAICVAFGGITGIGTLVCALGLGPIIHFFNRTVSRKVLMMPA